MYIHFINPPYFSTGWFSFFYYFVNISNWKIYTGFDMGIFLFITIIISYIFDRILLQHYYHVHLPENQRKGSNKLN